MLWVFIAPFVLPFSLVVGKAIGDPIDIILLASDFNAAGSARSGCSSECVFPFTYLGVTHYRCTDADHDRLWCATARDRNGGVTTWANCDQECHTETRCPSGWVRETGDIPGAGQIEGAVILTIKGCTDFCRTTPGCCSVEYSPGTKKCNLNRDCSPPAGSEDYRDYVFCKIIGSGGVSRLTECVEDCSRRTCDVDLNTKIGCNQMLNCAQACKMRDLGLSRNECSFQCRRDGASGCSLRVRGWEFQLCSPCNRRGCSRFPNIGECDAGCDYQGNSEGEACGSCFCPPTFTAGECEEGLVCIPGDPMLPDLPGTCQRRPTGPIRPPGPGIGGFRSSGLINVI